MRCGGVVLAGGRSSRMGAPKAALEWHGSTLLYRTVAIVARATGGPVVVVRARGQRLPELPGATIVVDDPREGKGPVQGIAAGLAAIAGRTEAVFVAATDLPFLHPAFVERVLGALRDGQDVALPVARGFQQPLAAGYRTSLAGLTERLAGAGRLKPAFLFAECTVARLDDAALLADPVLARLDPALDSVVNVNTPEEYRAALRCPVPEVTVRLAGALADSSAGEPGPPGSAPDGESGHGIGPATRSAFPGGDPPYLPGDRTWQVRAATLRAAADEVGLPHGPLAAELNGGQVTRDPNAPLASGDAVLFRPASPASARRPGSPVRFRGGAGETRSRSGE